jgi:hypothetical protein
MATETRWVRTGSELAVEAKRTGQAGVELPKRGRSVVALIKPKVPRVGDRGSLETESKLIGFMQSAGQESRPHLG